MCFCFVEFNHVEAPQVEDRSSLVAKPPSRIAVAQQSLIYNAAFVAPIQAEQIQEIELMLPPCWLNS